mmetsp:Transcript_40475/g.46053  ORF Transcript_40475/g.46053 Transcript_40475/m.46053 type:complete len:89 (-) Transcript_40475:1297-1563(-)
MIPSNHHNKLSKQICIEKFSRGISLIVLDLSFHKKDKIVNKLCKLEFRKNHQALALFLSTAAIASKTKRTSPSILKTSCRNSSTPISS